MVYIVLTVLVVLLGMTVRDRKYVGDVKDRETRIYGGVSRERAFRIGAAVMIFVLLAAVSAGRIAVGNDYWVYRYQFNLIMQQRHVSYEMGFNAVVWIIQSLFGYDNYLPVFAFFSLVTCAFFVKGMYDQAEWFGAALFLLMTGGYYFSSLNSVRYYLVLAIALYSMKYVIEERYGMFMAWIFLASLFHRTVLLVIPVYIIARLAAKVEWKKRHILLIAALGAVAVLGEGLWRRIIFMIYPYYEGSAFDVRNLSWVNIAKCAGTLLLCGICFNRSLRKNAANRFYFLLNVGGLLIYTCCSFIPEVSRVGYYLIISQIFLIPNLLCEMKKGTLKKLCIFAVTAAFLLYFAVFLYRAYDVDIRLLPYRNWILD